MSKQDSSRLEIQILINNDAGSLSRIILEPWADEFEIHKGDQIRLLASGPAKDAQIEHEYEGDVLVVNASPGWTLAVSVNNEVIFTASREIVAM